MAVVAVLSGTGTDLSNLKMGRRRLESIYYRWRKLATRLHSPLLKYGKGTDIFALALARELDLLISTI